MSPLLILKLVGSLALLMYGMKSMSESLQKMAGSQLRHVLQAMTKNRFTGMLTGAFVTASVQSSTATTVMTVSLVNAGLLTLAQAISIIMGANIGTTFTAWIMSAGFSFNITDFVWPAFFIAIILIYSKRRKSVGDFLFGVSFLLLGLGTLKATGTDMHLEEIPAVIHFFESFEDNYFWSPATMGIFVQTLHFPPIPKDVKTIDFYDCSPTNTKKMIQVTEDDSFMNDVRSIDLLVSENLKTTHVNDDVKDYFRADRVDFFKDKTVINCLMHTHAAHSVPGHVGNDFTLTLGNGKVIKAKGIEGVPADKDFDRHGDWIRTPFQVVFPVITEDEWNSGDGKNVLKGSVMHEPMTLNLNAEGPKMSLTDFFKPVKSLEKGEYKASVIKQEKMTIQGMDLGWMPKESFDSVSFIVKENGDIEISGDKTGHIADGTYFLKVGGETEKNGIPCSEVELVSSNTRIKFEAYSFSLSDKLSSIMFNTPTTINGVEVPDDADVWQLALAPKQ